LRWINFETAGLELAKEILRCHADLPVVLTTGYSHVLSEHDSRVILRPR
jgi:FixJ family two-component response regulator